MTTLARTAHAPGIFARAEAWLDDRGKPAWIVAAIAGFILFWPVGLALLAYMIWSKQMFRSPASSSRACGWSRRHTVTRTTGNSAFDAYKADTLSRLEEEQEKFEAFLQRLRDARDKAEFDQFMAERAEAATADDDPARG